LNKEKAIGWIQESFYAAIFVLVITAGATIYSILSNTTEGTFRLWNDWSIIGDIAIIIVLAFFIKRKSRFAASTILIYFLISKIMLFSADLNNFRISSIITSLIIIFFFARGAYATFVYHKLERIENPDYKTPSKKGLFIGVPIIIFFIVAGWLIAVTPGTMEVMKSSEISAIIKNKLTEAEVTKKGEKIDFFYSYGISDIIEEGVVFTDDYLIYYITDEDKTESYRLPYSNMKEIRLKEKGDYFNDTIIEINFKGSDNWIPVYLNTRLDRDMEVFNKIQSLISR